MTVLIPGTPENPVAILRRLEFQNPTLKTGNWRAYACKKGSGPAGSGWIMAVTLPEGSIRAIRALDYRPYPGVGRVYFKVTEQGSERGPAANEYIPV